MVGTDTGVGKTVVSLLLMHYFLNQGKRPFYIKPFQTGCRDPYDTDSDARQIYESISLLKSGKPEDSVIYCLEKPKAPYFAAKDQNVRIDTARVMAFIREKENTYDPLIIEGAGGLYVPVTEKSRIIDLVRETGARPLVVARAGLGTINHCLLTLDALKHSGIENPGLVFVQPADDPTSPAMVQENMEAITKFSGIRVSGLIPHIPDFSRPDPALFAIIDRLVNH